MRYGVCDTSPTHPNRTGDIHAWWDPRAGRWKRRTTPEHVRAGLPGWVHPAILEAKLSENPAESVAKSIAQYRAWYRYADIVSIESQARAFDILPRLP